MNEMHQKILKLQSKISTRLEKKYNDGYVNNIPYTSESIEVQDGWKVRPVIEQEDIDGWVEEVKPNSSLPVHLHPDKSELAIVVSGSVEYTVKKTSKVLSSGESIYIPCNVEHSVENVSEEQSKIFVIYEPPIGIEKDS